MISELRRHGDMGLGTFNRLDGEMIILDGVVYKASSDGSISIVEEDTTPFACVTFFDKGLSSVITASSFQEFSDRMDTVLSEAGMNSPYFVRILSRFPHMLLRSVPKQPSSGPPLSQIVAEQQVTWEAEEIEGTVVGLFCPSFMSSLNSHGWHLHFISDDRKVGGHVLNLSIVEAVCEISRMDSVSILLPGTSGFQSKDLGSARAEEIRRIESIQ